MALQDELGLPNAFTSRAHEALLGVFVTASLLGKEAGRLLGAFGLTQAQFDVLMLLAHQTDDGSADQTRLGRMLVVNRSDVTGLVDRMECGGLVTRTGDPDDRRVKRIRMTPEGARRLRRSEAAYAARTCDLVAGLSPTDLDRLGRLLESVRAALRAPPASRRGRSSGRGRRP